MFSFDVVREGSGFEVPSAGAAKQATRRDLTSAKTTAPSARTTQKRKMAPAVKDSPPPSLNAHPSNRLGAPFPSEEATQGPSLVDYSMEVAADFPLDMVLEMQRNAALKARRTVIGRTLGGKVTFKALQDYLKLHLLALFSAVTLLTRSYFEILFEDKEGARATKKLAAVEWSGWTFSFSKYSASFRSNVQGAETLLTHSVKVQFPDLHDQFRTSKALTIVASSISEVFEIESPNSYIKKPAGPMITVEVRDVSKLAGIIRIPSMVDGVSPGDMTAQRILYSGLLN